jgi:hypothetical protein
MKKFYALWNSCSDFDIPDDVAEYLLPQPYGDDVGAIGRWYIEYNTLIYTDKNRIIQRIEGSPFSRNNHAMKYPSCIMDEETVIYRG